MGRAPQDIPGQTIPDISAPPPTPEEGTHFNGPSGETETHTTSVNVLLGRLVIFATFVTLCNASCYLIPNKIVPGESTKECTDLKGNKHPINSRWRTDNCEKCGCGEKLTSCCSLVAIPVSYDTQKCQTVFKKEECKYTVVEKKDPNRPCDVSAWIL
ncbi:beta-microseminoprotein A1-like [Saimiri boliviensis]|uniref:beta-microseminoprotein A1-like n=1 Tax=Saimiri boliviensis TaxID=27679 RepID=UPI003D76C797